jgi:hypothetical protein
MKIQELLHIGKKGYVVRKDVNDALYDFKDWMDDVCLVLKKSFRGLQLLEDISDGTEDKKSDLDVAMENFKGQFEKIHGKLDPILQRIEELRNSTTAFVISPRAKDNVASITADVNTIQCAIDSVGIEMNRVVKALNDGIDVVNRTHSELPKQPPAAIALIPKLRSGFKKP